MQPSVLLAGNSSMLCVIPLACPSVQLRSKLQQQWKRGQRRYNGEEEFEADLLQHTETAYKTQIEKPEVGALRCCVRLTVVLPTCMLYGCQAARACLCRHSPLAVHSNCRDPFSLNKPALPARTC